VQDFSRQETLSEDLEQYDKAVKEGKRHASAAYEAIRETNPAARAGTVVQFYITGQKKEIVQAERSRLSDLWDPADPDENTDYYVDRFNQCAERFSVLFDASSHALLFGKEDLFGFDPTKIRTLAQSSLQTGGDHPRKEGDEHSIWLDLD
jgi:hypothetical protein